MNLKNLKYYYHNLPIIPVKSGEKNPVYSFSNFRRFTFNDFHPESNVAILTGTEISRGKFLAVLDCDINLGYERGQRAFEIIRNNSLDTIIVKSGGKHNGFHVYFTTDIPVNSGLINFNSGFIEVKGIRENGYAEQMMIPPSVNLIQYKVIYPEVADYIDFSKVRYLTSEELRIRISNITNQIKGENL